MIIQEIDEVLLGLKRKYLNFMPAHIDFNKLDQLSTIDGITKIQNTFELLISDLSDYLSLHPVNEKIKIKLPLGSSQEIKKISQILDIGINRIYENGSFVIELYEKDRDFLPFILLREAYYCFVPKEVKDNEMIKVYINQIIENDLNKASGFRRWHNVIRDALVDRDFLIAQSDKLQKFFKINATEEHESPVQFFFKDIHENSLIIGNRSIPAYYDQLFEKYTYLTSKSLYNKDVVKTLQILLKIFIKNKKYVHLTDYRNLYKSLLEKNEIVSNLSLKKFYENLQWINNCTSIAPSYNIVFNTIGIFPIICEISFNPLLERKKIKKLLENFPFLQSPRIIENFFGIKALLTFRLPNRYLNDILSYFNKLQERGYLISKKIFTFKNVRNFLNLNYYTDISWALKMIDPMLKSYKKEYECEHFIKFPFESFIRPLSVFEYTIIERISYLSVTGLTFDKRIETLNAIKEDIENDYRNQLTYINDFRESFKKILNSQQFKDEFLLILNQNYKHGFFYLQDNLLSLLKLSNLIEKALINNPGIANVNQFKIFLQNNKISYILEENLILQDINVNKIFFNDILPKYFQSIDIYTHEIEKIQLFYNVINSSYNLKIFDIESIIAIINDPDLIEEIYKTKEERIKKAFKLAKSYKITNQKIESTIDEFLGYKPPIIIPMLLNTIITSQFAKYYPEIFLKDTPKTRKKLENLKSYFPRVLFSLVEDLNNKENLIHLLIYSVNIEEKGEFISCLLSIFKEDLIAIRRSFWRGVARLSDITAKDFYDFENRQFFYTKDFIEQFFLYTQKIFGKKELVSYQKKKTSLNPIQFWADNLKMTTFVDNIKKKYSRQRINYNLGLIKDLMEFRAELETVLLDQNRFINIKSAEFFTTYINSIKFLPAFRKFGLAQYYLYFFPHDWNDIDLRLLFSNSFQSIKYPAQIDQSLPVFIKSLFPYRTPNKSYLNWLAKSKKATRECCIFFIKRVYDITHFDHNLSSAGWHYSSNRFKIHVQNILFNPKYIPQMKSVREFNCDSYSNTERYGLETPEFNMVSQIYKWRPLDLKSYLGTNKHSIIDKITSLLRKELIFPYLSFKNLGFQDKVSIILPNVKNNLRNTIIKLFSFFNVCRIYEIEGDYYFHGFKEMKSFETGFMIEIWFPKCEMDEIFDVFDYLFDYLEIKHYLMLTDLVNGKTLIKSAYGNLKFLEQYNPITNLKWNEKDKIWMNHKLFNEKFEAIYPDMLYGIKAGR